MRKSLKPAIAGVALALTPFVVVAEEDPAPYPDCTKQPSDGDTRAAQGAFAAGQAAYNEGDYDRAITYWSDAYRRDCTAHALLRNLATAYELSGRKKHALLALETFLSRNPDSPASAQIQRKISTLRDKIAEDSAQPTPTTTATTAQPTATTAPTSTAQTPPDTGGSKPITPLIVAGAGGLLTVVGAIVYFGAKGDVSDFEEQCPNRTCPSQQVQDDANAARSRVTLGGAVALIGLAAGVGGTIWYLTSPAEGGQTAGRALPRDKKPRVDAQVGPGFAGVSVSGRF